jgi:hypothetical protein
LIEEQPPPGGRFDAETGHVIVLAAGAFANLEERAFTGSVPIQRNPAFRRPVEGAKIQPRSGGVDEFHVPQVALAPGLEGCEIGGLPGHRRDGP